MITIKHAIEKGRGRRRLAVRVPYAGGSSAELGGASGGPATQGNSSVSEGPAYVGHALTTLPRHTARPVHLQQLPAARTCLRPRAAQRVTCKQRCIVF